MTIRTASIETQSLAHCHRQHLHRLESWNEIVLKIQAISIRDDLWLQTWKFSKENTFMSSSNRQQSFRKTSISQRRSERSSQSDAQSTTLQSYGYWHASSSILKAQTLWSAQQDMYSTSTESRSVDISSYQQFASSCSDLEQIRCSLLDCICSSTISSSITENS